MSVSVLTRRRSGCVVRGETAASAEIGVCIAEDVLGQSPPDATAHAKDFVTRASQDVLLAGSHSPWASQSRRPDGLSGNLRGDRAPRLQWEARTINPPCSHAA